MIRNLLPEEDALDDPDDDDDADPTLPGDLWFLNQSRADRKTSIGGSASRTVVYSRAFVPAPARNHATWRSIRMLLNQ